MLRSVNDDSTKKKSPSREIRVTISSNGHGSIASAEVRTEPSHVVPPSLEGTNEMQGVVESRVDTLNVSDQVGQASEIASEIVPSMQDFLDKCETVGGHLATVVSAVDSITEVCLSIRSHFQN